MIVKYRKSFLQCWEN